MFVHMFMSFIYWSCLLCVFKDGAYFTQVCNISSSYSRTAFISLKASKCAIFEGRSYSRMGLIWLKCAIFESTSYSRTVYISLKAFKCTVFEGRVFKVASDWGGMISGNVFRHYFTSCCCFVFGVCYDICVSRCVSFNLHSSPNIVPKWTQTVGVWALCSQKCANIYT